MVAEITGKKMAVIAIVIVALYIFSQCDQDRYKKGGKDYGANFDYGDDYYWDTNDHEVKKKAW
jgi:hypothetical protein